MAFPSISTQEQLISKYTVKHIIHTIDIVKYKLIYKKNIRIHYKIKYKLYFNYKLNI